MKAIQSLRASARNRRYVSAFWAANSFHEAAALDGANSPVGELAATGFDALRRADESSAHDLEHSWSRHDLLERHLRQQIHNARRREEAGWRCSRRSAAPRRSSACSAPYSASSMR